MIIDGEELRRRNRRFAAGGTFAGLAFPNAETLRVLTCVDARVDPADVLGLELGEALVMRNIGGRITPSVLRSWRSLNQLGPVGDPVHDTVLPHLVVMHHTDCGIKRLAAIDADGLADFFEIAVSELSTKVINDPRASLDIDLAIARNALSHRMTVTGLLYDVKTGLIDSVAPPTAEEDR